MDSKMIFIILAVALHQSISINALTSSTSTTSPIPQWSDPNVGGKYNNPGAAIHLSNKSIDQVHIFASDAISRAIQSMSVADFTVPIGSAMLTIKPPRITESKFANVENQLLPPNRVRSRFFNGRFVASGVWQYKPSGSQRLFFKSALSGIYRTTIIDGEMESINQLVRTYDSKPMVQTIDCQTNFSHFRVDIEGAGNVSLIENCEDPICNRIRSYFEDAACQVFRTFVKELINRKLSTFPVTIDTWPNNHKVVYGLMTNEPKVTEFDIDTGLEGRAQWYGMSSTPFSPNSLQYTDRNRMATFELSDFSFNSLLHQPHSRGYRYSAGCLLRNAPSIQDILKLNCSTFPKTVVKSAASRGVALGLGANVNVDPKSMCMGSIFDNSTNFGQFSKNDSGDFVFKSNQRAPSVIVISKDRAFFDASSGIVELLGPAIGNDQRRQLLGRADVRILRGEFIPKFNGANITGSIKITDLQLAQSRSFDDQWLSKLTQFAEPLLNNMFNVFFERYGQFPIPMLDGFECASPEFLVSNRTMQVACDIRVINKITGRKVNSRP